MSVRFISLLSEDRSGCTWRGLKAIVEKLLRRFEADGFTPRSVEILQADPPYRPILIANRWRSTSPRDQPAKIDLWRYIARRISEPGTVVIFHYDGDEPWSKKTGSAHAQFDREIRTRVEQVLSGSKLTREEIAQRMSRLVECVPFYSVEAWLYQATQRAIDVCREQYRGADVDKFKEWGANRTLLDDVPKPKAATCLEDKHNDDLGKHVPVKDVVQAGRSLTCFVWALLACPELANALALPD